MTDLLHEVDDEVWGTARNRAACVRALLDKPSLARSDVAAAARFQGVSISTMYRWMRRLRTSGDRTSALIDANRGNSPGSRRLPREVEDIVEKTIIELLPSAERPRPAAIVRAVLERCHWAGLRPPGENTIRRRIRAASAPLAQESTGRRVADPRRSRPVPGAFPDTRVALDTVQIDHTRVDVIVVDSDTRKPLGRPWITLAIDVCTRTIPGFYLALDAPAATSVGLCLAQVMTPKEGWLEARGLDIDWPVFGKPRKIHVDNAREFHSEALQRGCDEHGVELVFRPRGQPHYGGHIERLIGTMMGDVHFLPGTTYADVREKGRYDAEGRAQLTLAELERWLALAVDVYHRRIHSGIGTPPLAQWAAQASAPGREGMKGVSPPDDPERILIDFLPLERRRATRTGVRFLNIDYWSDALRPIAGSPERHLLRYDPRDLSRIWLKIPGADYLPLPYRRRHRPPISLWEHREAVRALKAEGARAVDEGLIFERVAAMRAIVDAAADRTRSARRAQARRPRGEPAAVESAPEPVSLPVRLFDVEEW